MDHVGRCPKEEPTFQRSFVTSEDNKATSTGRGSVMQASERSTDALQNRLTLERPISNYGSLENRSPSDIAHSFSPLSSSENTLENYRPEGVLRKIHADELTLAFCSSPRDDVSEEAIPATALLDPYWEETSFPINSFAGLLHELAYLQNHFPPASFREQASKAIAKKLSEKENLCSLLQEKESCSNAIRASSDLEAAVDHDIVPALEAEIKEIETSIAFIDVFVAYHEKLLAVNDYISAYNHLSYFSFPLPEERGSLFEKATEQLLPALNKSKKANQALLAKIPEHPLNKLERDLFVKIAAKDNGNNPFDLGLYRSPGSITPIKTTNDWLRERLQNDVKLTLPKETAESDGCIIN